MHDEVIRYSMQGEIADGNIVKRKERMVEFIESTMKDEGIVPSLDLEPQMTLDYKPETETYDFHISVYGVFVGGSSSWETAGVTNGKKIMSYTPQDKLKES